MQVRFLPGLLGYGQLDLIQVAFFIADTFAFAVSIWL
jgi:hypothetical protein